MENLTFILMSFIAFRLLVAAANALCGVSLRPSPGAAPPRPLVSVLIPMRNEAENIGRLLRQLQDQAYRPVEVIVCDDASTDGSAELVRRMADGDPMIRLVTLKHLPEGWMGKQHACHVAAARARGRYLLFVDADVRLADGAIESLLHHCRRHGLGLLSVFPMQLIEGRGAWCTVPLMNQVLLTLLPLALVRTVRCFPSLSAANGQCMFFDAEVYRRWTPHLRARRSKAEDIDIARMLKRGRVAIDCRLGGPAIACRMYAAYGEAVDGFAKNIGHFFGGSLLAALCYWLFTLGACALLLALDWPRGLLALACLLATKALVAWVSRQDVGNTLRYALAQDAAFLHILCRAAGHRLMGTLEWKGRRIP